MSENVIPTTIKPQWNGQIWILLLIFLHTHSNNLLFMFYLGGLVLQVSLSQDNPFSFSILFPTLSLIKVKFISLIDILSMLCRKVTWTNLTRTLYNMELTLRSSPQCSLTHGFKFSLQSNEDIKIFNHHYYSHTNKFKVPEIALVLVWVWFSHPLLSSTKTTQHLLVNKKHSNISERKSI